MIRLVSIDAGFANMGFCRAECIPQPTGGTLCDVKGIRLVSTEAAKTKSVRRSSDDFRRAQELAMAVWEETKDADIAFCEIPSGTQSARASWALGIALGVLTNVKCSVIQITPTQTKLAGHGTSTATKEEMIDWAARTYPTLSWIKGKGKKKGQLSPRNEHIADAVAIMHAGIETSDFKALVDLSRKISKR